MADRNKKYSAKWLREQNEKKRALAKALLDPKEFPSFDKCGHFADGNHRSTATAHISKNTETGSAHILQTACNSSFICPICSPRMMYRKSREIAEMIENAQADGWSVYLITQTVPHNKKNRLYTLMKALAEAHTATMRSRSVKELKDKYGYQGMVRTFDVVWSIETGWHPHFHNLLFFTSRVSVETLSNTFFNEYKRQMKKRIRKSLSPEAFDVEEIDRKNDELSGYITKLGLTSYITKQGKGTGSLYPFDLLTEDPDKAELYNSKFKEFAIATKGLARVRTSGGLRGKLLKNDYSYSGKYKVVCLPKCLTSFLMKHPEYEEAFLEYCDGEQHTYEQYKKAKEIIRKVPVKNGLERFALDRFWEFMVFDFTRPEPDLDQDEDMELAVEFEELED